MVIQKPAALFPESGSMYFQTLFNALLPFHFIYIIHHAANRLQ